MSASSFLNKRQKKDTTETGTVAQDDDDESDQGRTDEAGEEDDALTLLRYEVFYPSPSTSSIIHNPKYILKTDDKLNESWQSARHRNHRSTRRRRKISSDILEELSALDNEFDDSEEELEVKDEPTARPTRSEIVFSDFFETASRAEKLLFVKSDKKPHGNTPKSLGSEERSFNRKLVFLEKETRIKATRGHEDNRHPKAQDSSGNNAGENSIEYDPVRIILPSEQVSPRNLEDNFGRNYIECECFPRKFILDISDRLDRHFITQNGKKSGLITCLVFVLDVENEINSMTEDVYRVTVNLECHQINSMRIETVFDYMECSLEAIIERAIFFIETLPQNVLETRLPVPKKPLVPSNVDACLTWRSLSYKPDARDLLDAVLKRKEQLDQAEELGYHVVSRVDESLYDRHGQVSSPEGRFCDVCYEEVGGNVSATSLIACGHWFCDRCWREHLETRIRDGKTKLTCPEYECDKTIDPGTLMTLVSVQSVVKFVKYCHDSEVDQQSVTKWCPEPRCGGVLKVDNPSQKSVTCQCGRRLCFDCLGDAHWPAPCDAQTNYIRKLKKSGDDQILPAEAVSSVTVRGKPCPFCRRIIEKDGGCPFMLCCCGRSFCWGCQKDWNGNQHGSECYQNGQKNAFNTSKHKIKPDSSLTNTKRGNRWYSIALHHRVQQHPRKAKAMKKAIPQISMAVKTYLGREKRKGQDVSLDFDIPNKTFHSETEKVPFFLQSMVDLYLELHKLTEHTAILLDLADHCQDRRTAIMYVINRLDTFCSFIYELFINGAGAKDLVTRMKELRSHSRQGIKCLVRQVNALRLKKVST